MVKKILLVVLVLIVAFLGFVATRPSAFHVERSATMAAPSDVVFAQVNDFHQWPKWSPWEALDPAMKRTMEGGPGTGATYHWVGNDKVGEGRMTITESQPTDRIGIRLEFLKPMAATNATLFTFVPEGDQTRVGWTMDGTNNFMFKAMGVFMNMDKMIGDDFDKGLANLKMLSESEAAKRATAPDTTAAQISPAE